MLMSNRVNIFSLLGKLIVLVYSLYVLPSVAQETGELYSVYDEVGLDQKLGASISGDLIFKNELGEEVTLDFYFQKDKPVILNLVYHSCPMLCNVLLDGFTDALSEMEWAPGSTFDIVTISIDPNDTHLLANEKKQHYLNRLGNEDAGNGWHFLTGSEPTIQALTEAVGFKYKWLDDIEQFVHPAILTVLTPEGVISRYIQGLEFEPRDIRLALVEASDRTIAEPIDLIALYCLQYDPDSNSYVAHASNLMRLGGFLTVMALGTMLFVFWRRESNGYSPTVNT